MSPLANATIATVGSGVMAEAMIAGLLARQRSSSPISVVASHPRAERREALEREYGIRTVADNVEAVRDADVILLGIKPQMLDKVGREIGPHLRRGQLVLSVLAGATTAALTGILGHDQVVRSMPNTPARLGKGMTVWYATPETTEAQRAQAAALLGALGHQLEVDDEKMVAMATAVSGTGPTYVFLVMEALIDAAVHLGFPRHIAHDLVIETLEGSTLFAKQSGMHPAELRNMVTSPGRHVRSRAARARAAAACGPSCREAVWAAFRRTRRARRPARGQPSTVPGPGAALDRPMTATGTTRRRGRPAPGVASRTLRALDLRAADRDLWADEAALRDRLVRRWPDSTTPPGTSPAPRRRTRAGPTGRWPSTSATSPTGRSSPIDYVAGGHRHRRWPSRRRLRRRGFRPLQRAPPRALDDDVGRTIVARLTAARPRLLAAARRPRPGDDP